jgi:hypothetical protein
MEGSLLPRHEQLVPAPGLSSSNYDVTADGKRFLTIKDDDEDSVTSDRIVVVQGWADELSRLVTKG